MVEVSSPNGNGNRPHGLVLDSRGHAVSSQLSPYLQEIIHRRARELSYNSYHAASNDHNLGDWQAGSESPDETLDGTSRQTLVNRTRERRRNDPLLAGAMQKLVSNIVGTGIRAQAELDSDELNMSPDRTREAEKDIDRMWSAWQKESDFAGNAAHRKTFYDQETMAVEAVFETGESLTIPRWKPRPGYLFATSIQNLETDRVKTPFDLAHQTLPDGRKKVAEGIEVNKDGEIVAIHIANKHPGAGSGQLLKSTDFFRLKAVASDGSPNFYYLFKEDRPEQHRGLPKFASQLAGYRKMGQYVQAEIDRANLAASFGLIFTSTDPYDEVEDLLGTGENEFGEKVADQRMPGGYKHIGKWDPGSVHYAYPGDQVSQVDPTAPGDNFDSFVERVCTFLGAPIGLTRELMLNTFDRSNFSNTRLALEESRRYFRAFQLWLIAHSVEPIRSRVIDEAVLRGYISLPRYRQKRALYLKADYQPPQWPYMEPLKDAQASKIRMETGQSSLKEELSVTGKNWRATLDQIKKENDVREELGLALVGTVAWPKLREDTRATDRDQGEPNEET